jgi:maltose/maltodextrin transport system permease protein
MTSSKRPSRVPGWLKPLVAALLGIGALWLVFGIYSAGQPVWAMSALVLVAIAFYIYLSDIGFAYRYLFPGILGMLLFVAFPLVYTMQLGFTNYSSSNLLTQDRAEGYLLEQALVDEDRAWSFTLHPDGSGFRLVLSSSSAGTLVTPVLPLKAEAAPPVALQPLAESGFTPGPALALKALIEHRSALMQLKLRLPEGGVLSYAGLHEFAPLNPQWKKNPDGSLQQIETGKVYTPNLKTGYLEDAQGERLQPGFKVGIGLGNYARMFGDSEFRGPFFSIFAWTVAFAALSVLFSLGLGMVLAVVLNWEALGYRTVYRTLLFLPYAVPGFISILVFKGLFNQNFGEINTILDALLGIKPAWFADAWLAKVMILIVNTWLGYPYFMLLCTGMLKAIPADLYEASAIAGAKPLTNFFKITAPLITKPLMPLVISAFAFNFNNFVLIALLTNGRPDFLNTRLPAGTNDILVSYTYRIAFQDSGQNYGLAAAISTLIFFMVALMSLAHLKLVRTERS